MPRPRVLVPARRAGHPGGGGEGGAGRCAKAGLPADGAAVRRRRSGVGDRRLPDDQVLPAVSRPRTGSTCSRGTGWRWPLSWRRPYDDRRFAGAARAGWPPTSSMQWLRRSFITGFFVTVPARRQRRGLRVDFPGRSTASSGRCSRGGSDATCLGSASWRRRSACCWWARWPPTSSASASCSAPSTTCTKVPVFRTIYAPVKQLIVGVLARQRVRVQAGRARRGPAARVPARAS